MKAVLVIDMPTHCGECPVKCLMRGINHVPTWCPLKPLPETKDVGYPIDDYAVGFGDGWDACLKELTK